ncbi:PEP-CTERM sorting domain-containing protein [Akkermansiaceae bacterium]|nr:PEP-CTERM sorting domain-containing protein [Akkermansiaceae bacterium]
MAEPGGDNYDNSADTPPADEVAPNLTASNLDRVGGMEGFGNGGAVWSTTATPETTEISLSDYTAFTLTPDSGFMMSLDNVTYDYQSYGFAATGGYTFFIRSSIDNFAADLDTSSSFEAAARVDFDVSSLVDLTESTEIRIYASTPTAGNRWFDLQGSNTDTGVGLLVNGDVAAIPEPTSTLLSTLAALAFTIRRRR